MVGVITCAIIVVVLYFMGTYNQLISLKNGVQNGFAQIDTQLKRRFDLIPNLIECLKAYTNYEEGILTKIAEVRSKMAGTSTIKDKENVLAELDGALKQVNVSVEAYPELKANENFMMVQKELTLTENKIAYARQFYNDSVTRYNNVISMIPSNFIATICGFKKEVLFEAKGYERENVNVESKFSN